jgi:hypothetical protein
MFLKELVSPPLVPTVVALKMEVLVFVVFVLVGLPVGLTIGIGQSPRTRGVGG